MDEQTLFLSDSMYTEAARLKSFKNWPFDENCKCSASKMAEAGFFHRPSDQEPDSVQCYVCFKELDGWEPNDEPWAEHFSHSKLCIFAKIGKPQRDLTVSEVYQIENERKVNKAKRIVAQRIQAFKQKVDEIEEVFTEVFDNIESSTSGKA